MRELTKAEQLFCKEYEKSFKSNTEWIPQKGEYGSNILVADIPFIIHTKIKKAIMINPQVTKDTLMDMRYLIAKGYIVLPFTDEEVITDHEKIFTYYLLNTMCLSGEIHDYGLYCIDNAEKMEEVLRGAW